MSCIISYRLKHEAHLTHTPICVARRAESLRVACTTSMILLTFKTLVLYIYVFINLGV